MATRRQVRSNRKNAKKSTGPRTAQGKGAIGLNALKHGLLSRATILHNENTRDFEKLAKSVRTGLQPVGEVECLLVDRIISAIWRMSRLCRVEKEIFQFEKQDKADPAESLEVMIDETDFFRREPIRGCDLGVAFIRQAKGADAFSKLSRYEATIERSFYRALHELQRLQAARLTGRISAPAAIDIGVDVSKQSY